jgi:hypothetical protein
MGFEDEVEQSIGRPCRQLNGRSKRHCELTSSIVPRGTSFHHAVDLECPPIGFDPALFSCCCPGFFPGPAELGAVNPDAVHDHGPNGLLCRNAFVFERCSRRHVHDRLIRHLYSCSLVGLKFDRRHSPAKQLRKCLCFNCRDPAGRRWRFNVFR